MLQLFQVCCPLELCPIFFAPRARAVGYRARARLVPVPRSAACAPLPPQLRGQATMLPARGMYVPVHALGAGESRTLMFAIRCSCMHWASVRA